VTKKDRFIDADTWPMSGVFANAAKVFKISDLSTAGTEQLRRPIRTRMGCQAGFSAMAIRAISDCEQTDSISLKTETRP
jgi:hypothetical protein